MHKSEKSLRHFKRKKDSLIKINALEMMSIPFVLEMIQLFWMQINHIAMWFTASCSVGQIPKPLLICWIVQFIILCFNYFCKFGTKLKWYRYL